MKEDYKIAAYRKWLKERVMLPETSWRNDCHSEQRKQLLHLVVRAVDVGESNSVLIIGPRGSGKTTMINTVINEIQGSESFKNNAVLVRLHGFLHTDDRLALKDATRQMNLENVVGDKVFGSFAENLTFLLESLKSGTREKSKTVIFIIEEFDLFCGHHNQTLLYNLFDVSQSAQAPICIIGLTCRLDVIELLEKRVKSRFTHRQMFLLPSRKLGDRMKLLKTFLILPERLKFRNGDEIHLDPVLTYSWNANIPLIVEDPDVKDIMKRLLESDVTEEKFKLLLSVVFCEVSSDHPLLEPADFMKASKQFFTDAKINMLQGFSVLELCLIISMKHHTEIYDSDPFNFEMILDRYLRFISRNSTIQTLERSVIYKAFEHIKNVEFISPIGGISSSIQKEYQLYQFLLTSQQVSEAVRNYKGLPTEIVQWASSSFQ